MIAQRKEKPRLQRVEKPSTPSLASTLMSATGESSEQGWIISYADLLMILLCFFVLFYSATPNTQESVIRKILSVEGKGLQASSNQGSVASVEVKAKEDSKGALVSKISSDLSQLSLVAKSENDSLVVEFPDNSFSKGSSALGSAQKNQLIHLFEKLKPYQNEVNVILVGHTDSTAVVSLQKNGILDNFDLSAARAKSAYKILLQSDFPESHIKIEGDSSFERASRTLSVIIKPREKLGGEK